MSGSFVSTGSYSNLTRLELEQLRKADFYAGGKALTVGDAGNVGGGTGVGSITAEPYASGPLLASGNVDWVTPPTNPAINYPFRVDTSDVVAAPSYDDPIFWFGPTGLGRFDATVTATNQITKSSGNWTVVNGDIVVIASGHVDNVYAVGTVSAGAGTAVITLTNIRNAANGTVLTISGTTHSIILTRPGVSQLFAIPGSGPLGREQTFMFCTQSSTIHNALAPTDVAISNARIRNVVPPSFNGTGNDRADAIFDSPRSIASTVGYRPVFYRGLANGSGPDLSAPIATLNPVIDSTIPAADQRMTIDYKAGIVRFSCAPRAGDDIKPSGGIEGVNSTTSRLNLYAVWFAFPTANPATWTPVGAESSKQLYSPRSTSSQGVAPARVYFNGTSWVATPGIATDVSSFAGVITTTGGAGLRSSDTTVQSALDRVDDMLVARRAFTAVLSDGSASVGGDYNAAALFASANTLGSGKYFVRRGAYTTAVDLSTVYGASLIGEAQGLVTLSASTSVKLVASDAAAVHDFENIYFTVSNSTAKYNFAKHGLNIKNCRAQAGVFTLDFAASALPTRVSIDGLLVDTDNSINANNALYISNAADVAAPITGTIKNLQIRRVNSLNAAGTPQQALTINQFGNSGSNTDDALTFENCIIDPSTGFGAAYGSVLRIDTSYQPLVFRDCLIRCSQATLATVLTIVSSDSILFENCKIVQEGNGPLLSVTGNSKGITFKKCKFYTSPTNLVANEFNVICDPLSNSEVTPIRFTDCYLEVRFGNDALLERITFNRDGSSNTNIGTGPIELNSFQVKLNYASPYLNNDLFVFSSGLNAPPGPPPSSDPLQKSGQVHDLSIDFNFKRLHQPSARALVLAGNGTSNTLFRLSVTELSLLGVAEPSSAAGGTPATEDTCRLVALYNATVRGGEVSGVPQSTDVVGWKAIFEMNEPLDSVFGIRFWSRGDPNKGRLLRTTGAANKNNRIAENTVNVTNLASSELAEGWFCSVNTPGTQVMHNNVHISGSTGSLTEDTPDHWLISLGGSASSCSVIGNTTSTATGLRHIGVREGVSATGTITAVAGASLVNGETFTLGDGINTPTVFEFFEGVYTGDNVVVAYTSGDSASTVALSIRTAINNVDDRLLIVASSGGGAVTNLTHAHRGQAGNVAVTETVANAGFIVTGLTGGAGGLSTIVGNTMVCASSATIAIVRLANIGNVVAGNTAINTGTGGAFVGDIGIGTIGTQSVFTYTWDPGSIPAGLSETAPFTVPGAKIGDRVVVGHSVSLVGLTSTAYVSVPGVVTVVLSNATGAVRDLASHTITLEVLRSSNALY